MHKGRILVKPARGGNSAAPRSRSSSRSASASVARVIRPRELRTATPASSDTSRCPASSRPRYASPQTASCGGSRVSIKDGSRARCAATVSFSPASRDVTVPPDSSGNDFTGSIFFGDNGLPAGCQ